MELPYDKAIRKLDRLKNSRSYLENEPGFYIEDDAILREFLAAVFLLNALEMTTQELVKSTRTKRPVFRTFSLGSTNTPRTFW